VTVSVDDVAGRLERELGASWVSVDEPSRASHVVDGLRPHVVCRPAGADQIATVLRLCGEGGAAVTPWGGGTAVALGNVPQRVDVILRTDRLAALVEHDDANLTATVHAEDQDAAHASALLPLLQEKAGRVGFDWPTWRQAWSKVREEMAETDEAVAAGDAARIRAEFGDLLFSLVNVARLLEIDAEDSLRKAADTFTRRFKEVEAAMRAGGRQVDEASAEDLDREWEAAKSREAPGRDGTGR